MPGMEDYSSDNVAVFATEVARAILEHASGGMILWKALGKGGCLTLLGAGRTAWVRWPEVPDCSKGRWTACKTAPACGSYPH